MGRPKGSKNKIKKVVDRHPTKDKIKAIKAQKNKPKKMPKKKYPNKKYPKKGNKN